MRLDKLLTHLNCGSRKDVQGFIRAGRVEVDGKAVRDPAYKLDPDKAVVALDGRVQRYRAQRYYMLNKPSGVITANYDGRHKTVIDLFPENERRGLFAVGRLDKDTEGLLIVTDDGMLSHALMSPAKHVDKVYEAEVEGPLVPEAVQMFRDGLTLKDGDICLPAELEILRGGKDTLVRVTLREGKYHQVKRMIAAAGGKVSGLRRISLGGLELDPELQPGAFRELAREELEKLGGGALGNSTLPSAKQKNILT